MNPYDPNSSKKETYRNKVSRGLYFVFGTFFLILGSVGVFLPILPTTPLLLLSAACYYKSSKRMHFWMLNNRWFGKYLKNYTEGKGISLKVKLFTLSLLWILIIYSAVFVVNSLIVQVVLVSIAIGVTIHLIKLPTLKEK
ncbi:MAG: uncharacterized protein QG670_2420 [Thermoproteota archaeon]|nr:uncharacterized protein [Thermoproteota archaeon]